MMTHRREFLLACVAFCAICFGCGGGDSSPEVSDSQLDMALDSSNCESDGDCLETQYCSSEGVCTLGCRQEPDSCGEGLRCAESRACVSCTLLAWWIGVVVGHLFTSYFLAKSADTTVASSAAAPRPQPSSPRQSCHSVPRHGFGLARAPPSLLLARVATRRRATRRARAARPEGRNRAELHDEQLEPRHHERQVERRCSSRSSRGSSS